MIRRCAVAAVRRRLGAGVDSVMTVPSTKSITKTGTSSSSPAGAVANTRGVGTSVAASAVSSLASRSTSWAPGGNGGGGGRRTTTREWLSDTKNVRLEWPSPIAWAVTVGPHRPRSARKAPSRSSWSSDHVHITCPGPTGSPDSLPANGFRTDPRPARRRSRPGRRPPGSRSATCHGSATRSPRTRRAPARYARR